jgi:MscS family membrane protein
MKRLLIAAVCLVGPNASVNADPQSIVDLSTPRRVAESYLRFVSGESGSFDAAKAGECIDSQRLSGTAEQRALRAQQLAVMLSEALDQLELTIAVEALPDDPNSSVALIPLVPEAPGIYLTKTATGWKIAGSSLRAIERLHRRAFGRFAPAIVGQLPAWMKRSLVGIALWQVIGVLLAIGAGLVIRGLVIWLVGSRVRRLSRVRSEPVVGFAIDSAVRPLGVLAASLTLRVVLPELQFGAITQHFLLPALTTISTLAVIWLVYRQIDVLGRWLESLTSKTESRLDDQLVPLTRKLLKAIAIVLGLVFLLHNMGIQVTSLIAGLGIGGLAVALAAQETLSNFFASLVILADRPFRVGDLVNAGEITGTVEQVGLRSTRIRTADRSLVTVPNSKLASANIRNLGARQERFVMVRLGLTYQTTQEQLDRFIDAVNGVLDRHPRVKSAERTVRFDNFGNSALEVLVEFYVDTVTREEELLVRHQVFRELLTLPDAIGISYAYPTQTIHLAKS